MAFVNKIRAIFFALLAIVASGVLVYFGTGLFPWWPLMWFAALPVLLFAARGSWRSAAAVAFIAWFAGGLNLRHYFESLLHMPLGVQLFIFAVPSLLFALAVLLFRALLRRAAWWSAMLAFPAAWVSFEYVGNLLSPHGTGGNIGYSQLNFLWVLQVASIAGPWGISFLLMLFPAALVVAIEARRTSRRRAWGILGASWGLVALALIFGAVRLSAPPAGEKVKVGLIASDEPENEGVVAEGAPAERLFHAYAEKAEELASRGAKVIVLPEKLAVVVDSEAAQADALFQSVADRTKATIVVGMVYVSAPVKYNRARVYAPQQPVQSYDKHHMLPPFESSLKPGTATLTMVRPSGTWGVEICKDMDFTPLSRQYGREGVGLMLVPGWDFVLDRFSHGHMAVMRGVEDGFSIVRAAKDGYLTVSDDRGRLVAESRSNSAPFAALLAMVPASHSTTVYQMFGDWFAWIALVIFAVSLGQLFRF